MYRLQYYFLYKCVYILRTHPALTSCGKHLHFYVYQVGFTMIVLSIVYRSSHDPHQLNSELVPATKRQLNDLNHAQKCEYYSARDSSFYK